MKKVFVLGMMIIISNVSSSQTNYSVEELIKKIADNVIHQTKYGFIDQKSGEIYSSVDQLNSPSTEIGLLSFYSDFRYQNGVINTGMIYLGDALNNSKYANYTLNTIEFIFNNRKYFKDDATAQNKWSHPFGQSFIFHQLDDCGSMGASIIDAYFINKNKDYLPYLNKAAEFILEDMSRLEDGTFARPRPVEMSIWADDLYMSVPFLARMGKLTGESVYYDEAVKQVINFDKYLWDKNTQLYFHSWHSDEKANGIAHWGRANGWVMTAKVELLKFLPEDHTDREIIIRLLVKQIKGVMQYQSSTGLWHQLLDKNDSFLETSCTAMFTYGTAYAVNQGFMPNRYIEIAQKAWEAIEEKTNKYNAYTVQGICSGTGIGNSLNYYYNRETNANDVGFGAVLMAASELIKYELSSK